MCVVSLSISVCHQQYKHKTHQRFDIDIDINIDRGYQINCMTLWRENLQTLHKHKNFSKVFWARCKKCERTLMKTQQHIFFSVHRELYEPRRSDAFS